MGKNKWISKVEIVVPVHAGPQDGAEFLATNLEPERVYRLAGEPYVMLWHNGQPYLQYQTIKGKVTH